MLTPGPDHPIRIEPARNRWRARFGDHLIADSNDALVLHEADLAPVVYFPREDVNTEFMSRLDRTTHCPYKGEAGYYSLYMDGELVEDAVWTYDQPNPAVSEIAGRIAFRPGPIEVYEVDDARVNPRHVEPHTESSEVDEIVQHTDSGGGVSQREHWAPNTGEPGPQGGLR